MYRLFPAAALAAGSFGCATTHSAEAKTPDQQAVMTVIDQFVDGFNKGDTADRTNKRMTTGPG